MNKKERELMDLMETVVHRYAYTKDQQDLDVCRKPEIKLIEILGKSGPLMMTELATRASMKTSTVTCIMDGLVEKELVQRERSESDRRVVRVGLTKGGEKIYAEVEQFHLRLVRGMLSALSKMEQENLIGLFRKIVEASDSKVAAD